MYAKGTIGPPTNFSNKFGRVRGAIYMYAKGTICPPTNCSNRSGRVIDIEEEEGRLGRGEVAGVLTPIRKRKVVAGGRA